MRIYSEEDLQYAFRMSVLPTIVFFGTPKFATIILDQLEQSGFIPALIVTQPDRPKGRGLVLSPSETKEWALSRNISVVAPEKIRGNNEFRDELKRVSADIFIVAAYGKIIPKDILEIPKRGVLNVHPSLLPKFRGSSPIESTILADERAGVTIMLLDEEMDHGPILAQRERIIRHWPPKGSELTDDLAQFGGALLAEVIPEWIAGHIPGVPQDHARATFTKKLTKEDGLLDIEHGDAYMNYKKFMAFDAWPKTYFLIERNEKRMRVRITEAQFVDGIFTPLSVIPENGKKMPYEAFLRGIAKVD
jgi:methionyl-tRNA formyltransferase